MESPPERYRGERLNLAGRIPPWARRILVVGRSTGTLAGLLKKSLGAEVAALEADTVHAGVLAHVLEHVLPADAVHQPPPFPEDFFELILIQDAAPWQGEETQLIGWLSAQLSKPFGSLYAIVPQGDSPFHTAALSAGMAEYNAWHEGYPELLRRYVWPDYNPVELARVLEEANRHTWAYTELANVPDSYLQREDVAVGVNLLQLRYLPPIFRGSPDPLTSEDIARAQMHFYEVIARETDCEEAYRHYAEVTELARAGFLGRRALRSYQFANDAPMAPPLPFPHPKQFAMDSTFAWPGKLPRVLFIIHPRPHFGLDVLFDGLCEALGDNNVCAWPYKPSLHGAADDGLTQYPCTFSRLGERKSFEEVLDEVANGGFDLVLFGDCECELPVAQTSQLVKQAMSRGIPAALVDQLDECLDTRTRVRQKLRCDTFSVYFKREMGSFADYGAGAYPLPFAYASSRIHPTTGQGTATRDVPLFWAGHRKSGLRRLFLEHLERRFGVDLQASYAPAEYAQRLQRSRITLSLYGMGYDTVRYWEAPAHGSMLLSERMPIQIPHNFRDGAEAVFFDDLPDLESKLEFLLEDEGFTALVAQEGEAHYRRHHTSEARARQMLHIMHDQFFRSSP